MKVYNVNHYYQCQSRCEIMGLTETQKQTIAQRLRDGISIRANAAEVGVHKRIVLLTKQKIKPRHT
jgi:hypothetical protein